MLEGLDDDHAAAAIWAGLGERCLFAVFGIGGIDFRCNDAEQLAGPGDVGGAPAVGEQTVVTDTVEAVRERVDEETSNEFIRTEAPQGHALQGRPVRKSWWTAEELEEPQDPGRQPATGGCP